MNEFLIYFLKINIALVLFYILFRLLFYKDTFWLVRRIYLISAILISFLYPFISLAGWMQSRETVQVFIAELTNLQDFVITSQQTTAALPAWKNIFLIVYLVISVLLLTRVLIQLYSVLSWKRKSKKTILNNVNVRITSEDITPFSFFKSIYIHPELYNEEELNEVLTHENTHARQWHSLDVILAELLTVICWINPAAWLLKREIRQNLEFLADNNVLQSGCNTKNYQYHLLNLALHCPDIQIVNKFNIKPLKKRIIMMNQTKTKKQGLIKYLLVLPLAFVLILSGNAESLLSFSGNNDLPEEENILEVISVEKDDDVFAVVEQMPQFPGGTEALLNYISRSIRYPVDAQNNNQEGRVIIQYVVGSTGKISNIKVVRGVSESLDKEAIRIVENMPDWIPGEQRGEKVAVKYTLPIVFKLSEDKVTANADDIVVQGQPLKTENPLIIIDGKKMDKNFDLGSIDAATIDKMEVLKDAGAIAAYGNEGKDGVILITTKK